MRTSVAALLVVALTLTACGSFRDSRMNPRNWFGSSAEERPSLGPVSDTLDNRPLVMQITALTIEPTSSGALVRAEGVTPSAGWWDPQLVSPTQGRLEGGVLNLRFVAAAPPEPVPDTGVQSRTLTAVYPVPSAILDSISSIVVTGETNSRRARR